MLIVSDIQFNSRGYLMNIILRILHAIVLVIVMVICIIIVVVLVDIMSSTDLVIVLLNNIKRG